MTIETYYGTVEYKSEDLITFSDGLFGFPQLKHYLFLSLSEEDDPMFLMVSADEPRIEFVLVDPFFLCPEYSPALTPEELACLDVEDDLELSYYTICVVRENYLENTVNLKCPLVINPKTRQGMQVILEKSSYEYRHELGSFPAVLENANNQNEG